MEHEKETFDPTDIIFWKGTFRAKGGDGAAALQNT